MNFIIPGVCQAGVFFHGESFTPPFAINTCFFQDFRYPVGRNAAGFHGVGKYFTPLSESHFDKGEKEFSILYFDCRCFRLRILRTVEVTWGLGMKAEGGISSTLSAVQSKFTAMVRAP